MNRNTQGQTEMCVCVSLSKTSMVAGTFDHKLAHTLGSRLKAFEDLVWAGGDRGLNTVLSQAYELTGYTYYARSARRPTFRN